MTPYHFLEFLHSKYRGRSLSKEHLKSANKIVSIKWQGVLSDLCAFQAETNPFPQLMFDETFLEKVEPCMRMVVMHEKDAKMSLLCCAT